MSNARPLATKLETHRKLAPRAIVWLTRWMSEEQDALLTLAAGRHASGHFLYGDELMYEWSENRLLAEAAEEIADAINYIARLLELEGDDGYA